MATVFFSYSHKDESFRDELEAHLGLLNNQGLIERWHDRRIISGDEVDEAIFRQLDKADIILLLVSSDFINSKYCYSREMERAMERNAAQEARVIPVILRHCDWHSAPFGKLMAAPKDGRPIASWLDRDEAFADVAKQVRRAVEQLSAGSPTPVISPRPPALPIGMPLQSLPRSSNLRLVKEFSDFDRDAFLRTTFDFICNFFEGSIGEVQQRNPDVQGTFERIDTRRMSALMYRNGKTIAQCSVRLGGIGRGGGITFSYDRTASEGSFNEMLSVEVGVQALHLKSMGMGNFGGNRENKLSAEGAAELLWAMFIRDAQT